MPNIIKFGGGTKNVTQSYTPSASNQTIAKGYHNGTGVVYGDADLVAGNIKTNVNLFGVVGSLAPIGVEGGGSLSIPAGKITLAVSGSHDTYSGADNTGQLQIFVGGSWVACSGSNGTLMTRNANGGAFHLTWINNSTYKASDITGARIINTWNGYTGNVSAVYL